MKVYKNYIGEIQFPAYNRQSGFKMSTKVYFFKYFKEQRIEKPVIFFESTKFGIYG